VEYETTVSDIGGAGEVAVAVAVVSQARTGSLGMEQPWRTTLSVMCRRNTKLDDANGTIR
jgi:hypothetical protein